MPVLEREGVSLHYDVQGEGEPLVLISGLGGSSAAWDPVVPLLADRRVIRIDNRGTGQTGVPASPFTIDDMADDVAALIDELGVGPVDVVGWSMGGSILQSMLIRHGDVIRNAVLLSTFPSYTPVQDAWLDGNLAMRRAGMDPAAIMIAGIPWVFTGRMVTDHYTLAAVAEFSSSLPYPTSNEGFEMQAATLRVYDSRPGLPSVDNRVLVLVGAEDILTPPSQSVEMAQLIPNAQLRILPRGGHGMPVEYADDTVAAIKVFLAG